MPDVPGDLPAGLSAEIVARALAKVFDPALTSQVRPDSVLLSSELSSSIGMAPADAMAVAEGIREVAADLGLVCVVKDVDFASDSEGDQVLTVADLQAAVARRMQRVESADA